jgi:hypothetical protein
MNERRSSQSLPSPGAPAEDRVPALLDRRGACRLLMCGRPRLEALVKAGLIERVDLRVPGSLVPAWCYTRASIARFVLSRLAESSGNTPSRA